jgi:uncharacterized protein
MRIDYRKIVHYIYHHYIGIILVSLVLAGTGGYFAAKLKIKVDFATLLPDDYKSVHELNRIKERVGGIGPLMVVILEKDLDKAITTLHKLADSLEGESLISSISRGRNIELVSQNRMLYMDLADLEEIDTRLEDHIAEEKRKQSPLYFSLEEEELDFSDIESKYSKQFDTYSSAGPGKDYYLSRNKAGEIIGVILRIYPTGIITDLDFSRQLIANIDAQIAAIDPDVKYSYKGPFKSTARQYDIIINDLLSTGLYGFGGVLLLIMIYFRQPLAPLFVAVPLLMSIAWTFGVTKVVIGNLNMITAGMFAIIFGLGIDFGIHVFARYREARRRGLDVEAALNETVMQTGSALTTTALTTALAFYSLMITDFKGFSEFGFIVGTGIIFSLIAMLLTCPAFIVLTERLNLMRLQRTQVPKHLLRRGRYPLPWLTLGLGALATAYSLYIFTDVGFEYDFHKLKPQTKDEDSVSLPEDLKEERSPAIVLTESRAEAEAVVETVKRIKAANGDSSTISKVRSVYSALPADQDKKLLAIGRIKANLDGADEFLDADEKARIDSLRPYLDVRRLSLADLPEDITSSFTSKSGEILNFVTITAAVALRDGRNAIRFAEEIGEIRTPSGAVFYSSSAHIIFAETLQIMLDDAILAVVLTLFVVTLVLLIDLRSVIDTLLVLTPLLSALAWVVGFMYIFDIRLNLYNMVTFPTMIGMGIDNGVHIFHRYRESGKGSLRLVLRTTGMVLVSTSLTTMVGFAGLIPAIHPALNSIGILSLIGLGCCFLTSVTLLPALLQLRENSQR